MNLGNALRDQKRTGEAIEQYREAIRFAPEDPAAHGDLALVLASQGEFEAAAAEAREAVRLGPQLDWPRKLLADILRAQISGNPAPTER